jgi:hypothetical protein
VIIALMQWCEVWAQDGALPPAALVHDNCGQVIRPVLACPHGRTAVTSGNAHTEPAAVTSGNAHTEPAAVTSASPPAEPAAARA